MKKQFDNLVHPHPSLTLPLATRTHPFPSHLHARMHINGRVYPHAHGYIPDRRAKLEAARDAATLHRNLACRNISCRNLEAFIEW